MRVIAFGHRKYTGKDTATKLMTQILRQRGIYAMHVSFASALTEAAYFLYSTSGLREGHFYEDNPKYKDAIIPALGKSAHQIWIEMGMAFRQIHPDTWIRIVLGSKYNCDVLLISDLRFPNEAVAVKSYGGKAIKIEREAAVISNDEADLALAKYTQWDATIKNDGTLAELSSKLEAWYARAY